MVDTSWCRCVCCDRILRKYHTSSVSFLGALVGKCAYCVRIRHRESIAGHLYLSCMSRNKCESCDPSLHRSHMCFPYIFVLCRNQRVLSRYSDKMRYPQEVLIPSCSCWGEGVEQRAPLPRAFLPESLLTRSQPGMCACCVP